MNNVEETSGIVLVSISEIEQAEAIAEDLITQELAACINIIKNMTSIYKWEGKINKENEHLLIIKTTEKNYKELEKRIKS